MNKSVSSSSLASPSVVASSTQVKTSKLFYVAKRPQLLRLAVVNMMFTYLTLGGYYFKGMAETIGYMARYTAFSKNLRIAYSSRPLNFFKVVAPAIAAIVIAICIIQWAVYAKSYLVFFIGVIILYAAAKAGLFLARRYHLEHLRIGEVKLVLRLPCLQYMKCVMTRAILNIVTFGYAIPQSDIEKWNLVMRHVEVGSARFNAQAKAKNLHWIHMVSFYIPFMLCVVFMTMMAQARAPATDGAIPNPTAETFMMILFYLTILGGFIGRVWYNAALRTECLRGLGLNALRFKTTVTGIDLFKNRVMNMAVVFGTAGLGYPFMLHQNLLLSCKTTLIVGPVESILLPKRKTP